MWSNVTDEQLVIITLALLVMYLVGCAIGASIRRAELAEADETIDRLDLEVQRLSALLLDSAVLECIEGSVDCGTEEETSRQWRTPDWVGPEHERRDNVVPIGSLTDADIPLFGPPAKWDFSR